MRDIKTVSIASGPTLESVKSLVKSEERKYAEERTNRQNKGSTPRLRQRGHTVNKQVARSIIEQRSNTLTTGKLSSYNIGVQIGKGAYAIVKSGVHKSTGKKVAIKVYDKNRITDPQRKSCVDREIRILKRLSHDNIIHLYDIIDNARQLFIVMELVKGRSLYSYIHSKKGNKLDEDESIRIFSQIASGIDYCHKNSVTHRDIKMENLLLDEKCNAKIIDFGFSICTNSEQKLKIFCGTPSYMAPEIVMKKEYLGPPTDIWSLGILLFAMLCGCFPFKGINESDLFRCISKCKFTFPKTVSSAARALVNKMLRLDPNKRASAEELCNDAQVFIANRAKNKENIEGTIAEPIKS
jgi:serine/threonine protein kinase